MTKFFYKKIVGLLMVIAGFSYSLTTFYNFYDYIFGDLVIANANIYVMSVGLLFPLYIFIFGIHFYFYQDREFGNVNPFILTTSIVMMIVGVIRIIISNGIMQFIHFTFAYVIIFLAILLFIGCKKYKY